ncbi:hypothetical protein A6770_36830 [Nostoc minutum NIES-26]|uniref:Uncharacterized protein n=1 Tax=Nostoc minutum NIES-26 TaxID=1844469 RepID=A0A367RZ43_9NOSO|nr:hypothetical protein A6770_36830 [Nostoc minutum NIES-26]
MVSLFPWIAWNAAVSMWCYDLRNQLFADVFDDNRQEFVQFTNSKEITVETAWRWQFERMLQYFKS